MDRHVTAGGGIDRFDHLPVLTVRVTLDDGEPVIRDCNDRFARRLDRPRSELLGSPLRSVYAADPTANSADGGPSPLVPVSSSDGGVDVNDRSFSAETGGQTADSDGGDPEDTGDPDSRDGTRPDDRFDRSLVRADGSLVHTVAEAVPSNDGDGYVLYFVDVTRRRRRERQAEVLNRLMRHNVRNDLNLLRGYARTLSDHDDEAVVDAANVIDRIADRWLGLAGKVRQIERLFADEADTVRLRDVVAASRSAVEREWPSGRVDVELGVDPDREVSERLHVALVELCENGIKHAVEARDGDQGSPETRDGAQDAPEPVRVTVTVEPGSEPGWIVVRVADDGPGIPTHELTALRRDGETPLQHGSGLGFWLVRFVVQQLGGEVAAQSTADGAVTTLTVPLADDVSAEQ
ncbi:ATP-binding protein [Halobellus sp. GM3]|uniref:ATP-binding protein n=1 Tax=Halobellus sp. GM3 TaxID=3458410 RepID=UPI00403DD8E2